ncbi:hypothetical protein N802_15535 [Knoellia sinensis KCTC 19936]|uniref:Gram-positive cocci surface proteins LPxTG domain-containing protein n=1 Tax=Knoellia sinensis KCTC 19936 TaxID=1385520 RepID=A0A0A0J792_9MICO|nr:hypothetical protein [Knoellia sinensis]KGN33003.1 hypothetical protein N802_15535 [Knoellia sinensis KCTC 19936]
MSHTTSIRRAAATCGAAGIIALTMAAPASARPDPGTGEKPRCTTSCYEGGTAPTGPIGPNTVEGGVEFLQLGAGVLAGIAVVGAGAVLVSRRHHHAAHPA